MQVFVSKRNSTERDIQHAGATQKSCSWGFEDVELSALFINADVDTASAIPGPACGVSETNLFSYERLSNISKN